MALAKNLVKVYAGTTGHIDISEGILSIDIEHGINSWEGPWQQPDAGRFTIVSRNPILDPNLNSTIKFNQKIEFKTADEDLAFFIGYITDINVEYQLNDNPIITINGTDNLGLFKRILINQAMLDILYTTTGSHGPYNFERFMNGIYNYFIANSQIRIPFNFYFIQGLENLGGSLGVPNPAYRPAEYIPDLNESLWDVMVKYAQTNLDFIYIDPVSNIINIYPFFKYSIDYWTMLENPNTYYASERTFDSIDTPYNNYLNIQVNQNFNKITNQIGIANTSSVYSGGQAVYTNADFGPYQLSDSITAWGQSQLSIDTLMPSAKANNTEFTRYTTDIFEQIGYPSTAVGQISFDNTLRRLESYIVGEVVRVKHKVNDDLTINKLYSIAGIKHSINDRDWVGTFVFKPSVYQQTYNHQQLNPNVSISMNSTSGDTNFNFTATLQNYNISNIDTVYWGVVDLGWQNQIDGLFLFAHDGSAFKDNTPRHGTSLTFNLDDGGIVYQYGPGYKLAYAVIVDKQGYTTIIQGPVLTITAAQSHADFIYSKNQYDGYTFIDASGTDTDTWLWNFGDGTTSTLKNPPLKYWNSTGTKTVSLTVSNGITTDTKTVTITIIQSIIPVKYVKYEFKGIRNKVGGIWDKQFITYFRFGVPRTATQNISLNPPTTIIANKGTATVYENGHILPSPNQRPTGNTISGATTTAQTKDIKLNPLVTNGGNTEEFDIQFIVDISKIVSSTEGTDGSLTTIPTANGNWLSGSMEGVNFNDAWLLPKSWSLNVHYEPINVYVSADGTNYFKVGDWNVYRTAYPPAGSVVVWSLDNKVPMPPRFHT